MISDDCLARLAIRYPLNTGQTYRYEGTNLGARTWGRGDDVKIRLSYFGGTSGGSAAHDERYYSGRQGRFGGCLDRIIKEMIKFNIPILICEEGKLGKTPGKNSKILPTTWSSPTLTHLLKVDRNIHLTWTIRTINDVLGSDSYSLRLSIFFDLANNARAWLASSGPKPPLVSPFVMVSYWVRSSCALSRSSSSKSPFLLKDSRVR